MCVNESIITYTDFMQLLAPRNPEFATYAQKKVRGDAKLQQIERGVSEETHMMLRKLFEDMTVFENDLERARKGRIGKEINGNDIFNLINEQQEEFVSINDYLKYFKENYVGELPFCSEDVGYLFKRHDRYKQGRVSQTDFIRELMPLPTFENKL